MIRFISFITVIFLSPLWASAEESLITVESHYSVQETADRFESIILNKGLTLFARINHQKNASDVNLKLRATEVIIFGNPLVGTPLMQCEQKVAIDLPQKVLISEDLHKRVWLSYNNPEYIKNRHAIKGCDQLIKKVSSILDKLSIAATAKK